MSRKTITIIISVIIALAVAIAVYFISFSNKAQPIVKDKDIANAQITANGDIKFFDKGSGEFFNYGVNSNKTTSLFKPNLRLEYEDANWSPDAGKALVRVSDETNLKDGYRYYLLNSKTPSLISPLNLDGENFTWIDSNTLGFPKVQDYDLGITSGLFTYDVNTQQESQFLSLNGSSEDEFVITDTYIVYVNSSTDDSPVNVTIYDRVSKKLLRSLKLNHYRQIVNNRNRALLVGEKVISIQNINGQLSVTEFPIAGEDVLYTLHQDTLYGLSVQNDKQAKLFKFSLKENKQWIQSSVVEFDTAALAYIYNFTIIDDNHIAIAGSKGIIKYKF